MSALPIPYGKLRCAECRLDVPQEHFTRDEKQLTCDSCHKTAAQRRGLLKQLAERKEVAEGFISQVAKSRVNGLHFLTFLERAVGSFGGGAAEFGDFYGQLILESAEDARAGKCSMRLPMEGCKALAGMIAEGTKMLNAQQRDLDQATLAEIEHELHEQLLEVATTLKLVHE